MAQIIDLDFYRRFSIVVFLEKGDLAAFF